MTKMTAMYGNNRTIREKEKANSRWIDRRQVDWSPLMAIHVDQKQRLCSSNSGPNKPESVWRFRPFPVVNSRLSLSPPLACTWPSCVCLCVCCEEINTLAQSDSLVPINSSSKQDLSLTHFDQQSICSMGFLFGPLCAHLSQPANQPNHS